MENLPIDVLALIASFLDVPELYAFGIMCHRMHLVAKDAVATLWWRKLMCSYGTFIEGSGKVAYMRNGCEVTLYETLRSGYGVYMRNRSEITTYETLQCGSYAPLYIPRVVLDVRGACVNALHGDSIGFEQVDILYQYNTHVYVFTYSAAGHVTLRIPYKVVDGCVNGLLVATSNPRGCMIVARYRNGVIDGAHKTTQLWIYGRQREVEYTRMLWISMGIASFPRLVERVTTQIYRMGEKIGKPTTVTVELSD